MTETLSRWWANDLLRAVLFAAGGVIVGWITELLTRHLLLRITRRTKTDLDDLVIETTRRPIRGTVVLLGLWLAADALPLPDLVTYAAVGLLKTTAVVIWGVTGMRLGSLFMGRVSRERRPGSVLQPRTLPLLEMSLKLTVVGVVVYLLFVSWHIDVSAWLASAGVIGIAVGFAAKDTLANLFAGFFILADAPYKLGDYIVIDGGLRGRVTAIGLRSTRILTRDDVEITVPNAVIAASRIINESGGPMAAHRLRLVVGVAYGSDVDTVRATLLACATPDAGLCADPEPRVRFRAFLDSSLKFELLFWIEDPATRGRVLDVMHTRVYNAFREAGIEIPFPQQDVHVRALPPADDR